MQAGFVAAAFRRGFNRQPRRGSVKLNPAEAGCCLFTRILTLLEVDGDEQEGNGQGDQHEPDE